MNESFAEYEQRKINEMRDTALHRQRRKVIVSKAIANHEIIPLLKLTAEGDALLFEGQVYSLFFAHGNLRIENTFAKHLRQTGYSSSARKKIHGQVKNLVAASPLSCNILGANANQPTKEHYERNL